MRFMLEKRDDGYRASVWLDERRKVTKDDPRLGQDGFTAKPGEPDPDWVREHSYGLEPPETGSSEVHDPAEHEDSFGVMAPPMRRLTAEEYEQSIKDETILLAKAELDTMQQPEADQELDLSALARAEKV